MTDAITSSWSKRGESLRNEAPCGQPFSGPRKPGSLVCLDDLIKDKKQHSEIIQGFHCSKPIILKEMKPVLG